MLYATRRVCCAATQRPDTARIGRCRLRRAQCGHSWVQPSFGFMGSPAASQICAGTRLTPATSAPGRTGLGPATSAPGLGRTERMIGGAGLWLSIFFGFVCLVRSYRLRDLAWRTGLVAVLCCRRGRRCRGSLSGRSWHVGPSRYSLGVHSNKTHAHTPTLRTRTRTRAQHAAW